MQLRYKFGQLRLTDLLIKLFSRLPMITNIKFTDAGIADATKFNSSLTGTTENANATGAGNGVELPSWATGWSVPATM